MEELKRFCVKSQIDIIEVYTAETRNKRNDYRTRVFAPTFGYLEDPATGSGNSPLVTFNRKRLVDGRTANDRTKWIN
jgi:predicted PhzF superfamily epimerase YddE/YHI9